MNDGFFGGLWAYFAPHGWATHWYWPAGVRGKAYHFFHRTGGGSHNDDDRSRDRMTDIITRDELTIALASMRLWVRAGPFENVAWRLLVMLPEHAADDIFASVELTRAAWPTREEGSTMQQPLFEGSLRPTA